MPLYREDRDQVGFEPFREHTILPEPIPREEPASSTLSDAQVHAMSAKHYSGDRRYDSRIPITDGHASSRALDSD